MKEPVGYRIKSKEGKYSTGGRWPSWTPSGKVWGSIGALNRHLSQGKRAIEEYMRHEAVVVPLYEGETTPELKEILKERIKHYKIESIK